MNNSGIKCFAESARGADGATRGKRYAKRAQSDVKSRSITIREATNKHCATWDALRESSRQNNSVGVQVYRYAAILMNGLEYDATFIKTFPTCPHTYL